MNWSCEHIEERLSEYVDRVLAPGERAAFDAHLARCAGCTARVARVSGMVAAMHRLEPVEAPAHLVGRILDRTLGPRGPKEGWRGWFGWTQVLVQPRFALGAVTVLITFSIVSQALGISWSQVTWKDLHPAHVAREVNRRGHLVYARGVKFVNDLRVVYEIQSRLKPEAEPEPAPPPETKPGDGKAPAKNPSLNRATERNPNLILLASVLGAPAERSVR
jgi:anti-sigma factor RsiW